MEKNRCAWCDLNSKEYVEYHDQQWGVPVHDDRLLFEMLILEGMQAGLSWISILKKRQNFLNAFDNFDVETVAGYDDEKIEMLLQDPGIIRNRLKVNGAVRNAKAFLKIRDEFGSFDRYIWAWVDHRPMQPGYVSRSDIPSETELSRAISKDLKKHGMTFVGPVIIYAFMQAIGMVNDHDPECYRRQEVAAMV